jgi:hypothetical protein
MTTIEGNIKQSTLPVMEAFYTLQGEDIIKEKPPTLFDWVAVTSVVTGVM